MSRAAEALRVVLDANVLYPQWLRDVMLTLAAMGHYDPVWSQQVIDEMRRNVLGDHPDIDPQHFDDTTITALRRAFPDAWVEVSDELMAEMDNATRGSPCARRGGGRRRPDGGDGQHRPTSAQRGSWTPARSPC